MKLDGYRAIGVKTGGTVLLCSRNDKDFNLGYPQIARALAALPDETMVDGEVVALAAAGRPSFKHSRTARRERRSSTTCLM